MKPMPRAQTSAFIFSQFTTRGAVHYMGLPEQDYFGSQPQPSGKKVKINNGTKMSTSYQDNASASNNSNMKSILPSSLNMKMTKYDIKGKQRCAVEEDIYEEIDDYKVEFRNPKCLASNKERSISNKNSEKSTYSFEPPDNCASEEEEEYDETHSPNGMFKHKVFIFLLAISNKYL